MTTFAGDHVIGARLDSGIEHAKSLQKSCPRSSLALRLREGFVSMTNDLDKIKPVRFPTTWLTYRQRIRLDLDRAYNTEEGEAFFDQDYLARLTVQAKQLDDWLIKLLALQLGLTAFQVIGFVNSDASLSLFGITLKQATGVKEILLLAYWSMAACAWTLIISRDTTLVVLERLVELSADEALSSFGKLAAPTAFGLKVYVPRAYVDWIFPTRSNKGIFAILYIVALLLLLANFGFSLAVNVVFALDVYRHPTLGSWSNWILAYVGLTALLGILVIGRFYLPQPYRDKSALLALQALEKADHGLYLRKHAEIFGSDSRYRKYTWSYYWRMKFRVILSAPRALGMTVDSKLQSWLRRRRRSISTRRGRW